MNVCSLENNPSVLLSEWKEEIKRFCADPVFLPAPSDSWFDSFQALLSRFRAWDYLMVHQVSSMLALLSEAEALVSHPGVPGALKEKIEEFVTRKIRVVTDLPENRDFAERFFEARYQLISENRFRRFFVQRYIEREAYSAFLAPIHEVSAEIAVHEQSIPYLFEAELRDRVLELAREYGEDLPPFSL